MINEPRANIQILSPKKGFLDMRERRTPKSAAAM
jgi:hypothetical protein